MESTREFEVMNGGILHTLTVVFEWEAWVDCFDPSDSSSQFYEWEHEIKELYYTTEDNKEVHLKYELLRPEHQDFVDYNINSQIENEIY